MTIKSIIGKRMLGHAPEYYAESPEMTVIYDQQGIELDDAAAKINDIALQAYVNDATTLLAYYERELRIVSNPSDPVELRRRRILAKMLGAPKANRKNMTQLLNRFTTNKTARAIRVPNEYAFWGEFDIDDIVYFSEMRKAVERRKPAHMEFIPVLKIQGHKVTIIQDPHMTIKQAFVTSPWAMSGGENGEPLFMDGAINFDANYYFVGRRGGVGAKHTLHITMKIPVKHDVGTLEVFDQPAFNAQYTFDGDVFFDSVPQAKKVLIRQSPQSRIVVKSSTQVPITNAESTTVKTKPWTGAASFNGNRSFDGDASFRSRFVEQSATMRIIKQGVTTEVIV